LTGIAGTLSITIADGKHLYDFQYSLPTDSVQAAFDR
jgi:hypothetical protein